MLREEQATELLRRCELITGQRLKQIRGNLRKAQSRAAAIWELLVIEEVSKIGKIKYEPKQGGSPDILLSLPNGRDIWIEIAFLYPRFWKQERQSRAVADWITGAAKRQGISPFKVSCEFDGDRKNKAGPVRSLPGLHEKNKFSRDPVIRTFFNTIKNQPEQSFTIKHRTYSLELFYSPKGKGPYLSTGGGLAQEAPKTVKEHAVYRVLKEKTRQHHVEGPRLVCIGSDQSPALSNFVGPGTPKVRDAVFSALRETQSLSGVAILRIEDSFNSPFGFQRRAKGEIFVNPNAKYPLLENEIRKIYQLNFNRWKYFFRLEKYDEGNNDSFKRVGGMLSSKHRGVELDLEIPCNVLIDSLAGKTNLIEQYSLKQDDLEYKCLHEGWAVKSCSWKEGDIEAGEAPKVVLGLTPLPETVFWSDKKRH